MLLLSHSVRLSKKMPLEAQQNALDESRMNTGLYNCHRQKAQH